MTSNDKLITDMEIEGLEKAARLLREREAAWRALADNGGTDMHPEHDCWCRAYEAMSCAELIEEMTKQTPNTPDQDDAEQID